MVKRRVQGKRGPKPTGQGKTVGVRLHPPVLKALDDWIAKQPNARLISRAEGVRQLMEIALGLKAK
jgi:hypothetical protein